MFESEKSLLKRICLKNNAARVEALENELKKRRVQYENWHDMAVVVPSTAEKAIVLSAHLDAVEGSFGYNDNGMAVVAALGLIGKLPGNVEIVFTNYEEEGGLGAEYYLARTQKQIIGCVNLDVVGCFNQVYLDPMNCSAGRSLSNCKQGRMPYSDAYVFAERGIPSVCFSSGPAETDFCSGIKMICSTLHNNCNDNNFSMLNFEMIEKISENVKKMIDLMKII